MAETLSMDAIKNYLIKVGCKIEYSILVNAFKQHLYNPDAQLQAKIRTQFKDYVNRLATVSLENNMKFINLRPEFRPGHFVDGGMRQIPPPHQTPQPRWAVEASNCNYNGLIALLKEDPKLATHKDIINGYTALHWAAKFGNLDIIKLIAGTHNVSADIKSSAGYTPLHIAYMFDRPDAVELLLKSYNANANIRDHSGKRPKQYARRQQQR